MISKICEKYDIPYSDGKIDLVSWAKEFNLIINEQGQLESPQSGDFAVVASNPEFGNIFGWSTALNTIAADDPRWALMVLTLECSNDKFYNLRGDLVELYLHFVSEDEGKKRTEISYGEKSVLRANPQRLELHWCSKDEKLGLVYIGDGEMLVTYDYIRWIS